MTRAYHIGELAALTGVSVRTLRHYDQIGLLRPSGYTDSGYRLYQEGDLLRLQQVLTLRYLGFPLREIGELLAQPELDQVEMLRSQRSALLARIASLQRVEQSMARLLEHRLVTGQWEWELVADTSANTQHELERGGHHMTPEERKRLFEQLGKEVTPEEIASVQRNWADLLGDVRANYALDPASPQAQALGDRWDALIQATFRGHTELQQGVAEGYRNGEFANVQGAPTADDFAFIHKVWAARTA